MAQFDPNFSAGHSPVAGVRSTTALLVLVPCLAMANPVPAPGFKFGCLPRNWR